jgi:hypothetical protein
MRAWPAASMPESCGASNTGRSLAALRNLIRKSDVGVEAKASLARFFF